MAKLYGFLLMVTLVQGISAQVNVHVFNPWRNDSCAWHRDSLRMSGNSYVGYYPGSGMQPEGDAWFYYAYPVSSVSFTIVNWCGPDDWEGRQDYRFSLNLDSILINFPDGTNAVWITILDTLKPPIISDKPPLWFNFLNP